MAGFLLDTNVISELIKPAPKQSVVSWTEEQVVDDLYLSAITIGELVRGLRRLADGRKRRRYDTWVRRDLARQFEGRILVYDRESAIIWGEIMGDGDRKGRPKSYPDAQIASIARRYGLVLVTRNTRDFKDMDVDLFDPWEIN